MSVIRCRLPSLVIAAVGWCCSSLQWCRFEKQSTSSSSLLLLFSLWPRPLEVGVAPRLQAALLPFRFGVGSVGRFGSAWLRSVRCVCVLASSFFSSSSSFSSSFRSGAREKTLLRSLFGDDGADRDVAVTRLRQQKKRKHKKRAKKTNKTKHSIQAIDPSAPMNGGDCLETRRKTSSALGHG